MFALSLLAIPALGVTPEVCRSPDSFPIGGSVLGSRATGVDLGYEPEAVAALLGERVRAYATGGVELHGPFDEARWVAPERFDIQLPAVGTVSITSAIRRLPSTSTYVSDWDERASFSYCPVRAEIDVAIDGHVLERWESDSANLSWSWRLQPGPPDPHITTNDPGFGPRTIDLFALAREHGPAVVLADLPFTDWQEAAVRALATLTSPKTRARIVTALRDVEGTGIGLTGAAASAIRELASSPSVPEAKSFPTARYPGRPDRAGATLLGPPHIRWWVAGVELAHGGTASVGGLVDLRWETDDAEDPCVGALDPSLRRGHALAALAPGVTVEYACYQPHVRGVTGNVCARFGPGAQWGVIGGPFPHRTVAADAIVSLGSLAGEVASISGRHPARAEGASTDVVLGLPGMYDFRLSEQGDEIRVGFTPGEFDCSSPAPKR